MLIAYVPLLIAIVGLLVWLMAGHAIAKKSGEYMFLVGLFWTVYSLVGHVLKL